MFVLYGRRLELARVIYKKKLRRRMFRLWRTVTDRAVEHKQNEEHTIKRQAFNRWTVAREAKQLQDEARELAILRIRHRLLSRYVRGTNCKVFVFACRLLHSAVAIAAALSCSDVSVIYIRLSLPSVEHVSSFAVNIETIASSPYALLAALLV